MRKLGFWIIVATAGIVVWLVATHWLFGITEIVVS